MFKVTIGSSVRKHSQPDHFYLSTIDKTLGDLTITFNINYVSRQRTIQEITIEPDQFIFNSLIDKLRDRFQGKNIKELNYFRFNRNSFLQAIGQGGLTHHEQLKYDCLDVAKSIIEVYQKELKAALNDNAKKDIIFYRLTHEGITAFAIDLYDLDRKSDFDFDKKIKYCMRKFDSLRQDIAGLIEVYEEDEVHWLDHIKVEESFRRQGIATTLIILAKEYLELDAIPCVQEHHNYRFSLSPEGEQLIVNCIEKEIITSQMCYFSGTGALLEEGEDDPGYDSMLIRRALDDDIASEGDMELEYEEDNQFNY